MSLGSSGPDRLEGTDAYKILNIQRRKQTRLVSDLLNRHPLLCSLALLAIGGTLVALGMASAKALPRLQVYALLPGIPLLVFGALLLLVTLIELAARAARRLLFRPDPALAVLRPLCDGRPAAYESSRLEMVWLLQERLGIPAEAAEERLHRLEESGKLAYMPAGHWAIVG